MPNDEKLTAVIAQMAATMLAGDLAAEKHRYIFIDENEDEEMFFDLVADDASLLFMAVKKNIKENTTLYSLPPAPKTPEDLNRVETPPRPGG